MADVDVLAQLKEIEREVTERQGLRVDEVNRFFLRKGLFSSIPVVRKLADALAEEKIIVLQRDPDSHYRSFDAEAIARLEWALRLKLINWPVKKIVRLLSLLLRDICRVVDKDAPVTITKNRLARLEASNAEVQELLREAAASFERLTSLSQMSVDTLTRLGEVPVPILAFARKVAK